MTGLNHETAQNIKFYAFNPCSARTQRGDVTAMTGKLQGL